MSEIERDGNEREDAADVRWLLARERGQPGLAVSAASMARYAQLEALIADLPAVPAGVSPRAGWQRDVLAAIDAEEAAPEASRDLPANPSSGRAVPKPKATGPRRWAAATAGFAMAAAVVIVFVVYRDRGSTAVPALAFEVEAGNSRHRGSDPSIGDKLIFRGVVEGPGELRVYNRTGVEQARCTVSTPVCTIDRSGHRTTLRLTMQLRAPGALCAVLFAAPLGGSSGGIDADVAEAMRAGIAVIPLAPVEVD